MKYEHERTTHEPFETADQVSQQRESLQRIRVAEQFRLSTVIKSSRHTGIAWLRG
jgi:hypothetical protein